MSSEWDQLQKLRREYPKSKLKFALPEITRRLKKRPHDSYLQAWRADIALQLGDAATAEAILSPLYKRQPPIPDSRLLSYIYHIQIRAMRSKSRVTIVPHAAGEEVIGAWKSAAKHHHHQSRKARLDFWSDFFICAMKEGCWADVQQAIAQVRTETGLSKKQLAFTEILAYQLSYEAMRQTANFSRQPLDPKAEFRKEFAFRKLTAAYQNAGLPKDPVQIEDIRDIRFMGQIFERQGRLDELFKLWHSPPPSLKDVFMKSDEDLALLTAELLAKSGQWENLGDYCWRTINALLSNSENTNAENQRRSLTERNWQLFRYAMMAREKTQKAGTTSGQSTQSLLQDTLVLNLRDTLLFKGRAAELTRLAMTSFAKGSLLPLCKSYWLTYRHLNSCFHDLRGFVENLSRQEQGQFHALITATTKDLVPEPTENDEKLLKTWLQVEVNVLKFDYLLCVSIPKRLNLSIIDCFVSTALRLFQFATSLKSDCRSDIGCLAIMGLLMLYHFAPDSEDLSPDQVEYNTRLMLQAAALSLQLTAGEDGDQNRPLLLLSSRLHLTLGLTTLAFRQYSRVPIKQMLLDTVSFVLLSRISQVHPFDTLGSNKVLPNDKLVDVIRGIQQMESKVDDFLYVRLKDFQYDQALELVETQQRLRTSFTKHICVIERRRIARLTGEPLDESMDLELRSFTNIKDNRDFGALPSFECKRKNVNRMLMPNSGPWGFPNMGTLWYHHMVQETAYKMMNSDTEAKIDEQYRINYEIEKQCSGDADYTSADWDLQESWRKILEASKTLHLGNGKSADDASGVVGILEELLKNLRVEAHDLYKLQEGATKTQTGKPVDVNLAIHEKTLMYWYGLLELYQACWKLCDFVQDHRKKSVMYRTRIKESVLNDIRIETKDGTENVRKIARFWIDFLKVSGNQTIKEQLFWGPTGQALRGVLSDADANHYASEYVNSYIDSLGGLLKVRVGK